MEPTARQGSSLRGVWQCRVKRRGPPQPQDIRARRTRPRASRPTRCPTTGFASACRDGWQLQRDQRRDLDHADRLAAEPLGRGAVEPWERPAPRRRRRSAAARSTARSRPPCPRPKRLSARISASALSTLHVEARAEPRGQPLRARRKPTVDTIKRQRRGRPPRRPTQGAAPPASGSPAMPRGQRKPRQRHEVAQAQACEMRIAAPHQPQRQPDAQPLSPSPSAPGPRRNPPGRDACRQAAQRNAEAPAAQQAAAADRERSAREGGQGGTEWDRDAHTLGVSTRFLGLCACQAAVTDP